MKMVKNFVTLHPFFYSIFFYSYCSIFLFHASELIQLSSNIKQL